MKIISIGVAAVSLSALTVPVSAQMSGEQGDFARLYVMAHEYGHHIQNLTGLASQIRSAQQQDPRRVPVVIRSREQIHVDAGQVCGRKGGQVVGHGLS